MTYNIIFEWIPGAWNKAANYLSRLVKLPSDSKATIKMLIATISDRPAFITRSKTSHQHQITINTEPSSTQPIKETVTPHLTTVKATQDVTPKPLTIDMKPYSRCRRWIHFVNVSPNGYQMARHQSMRPIYSYT